MQINTFPQVGTGKAVSTSPLKRKVIWVSVIHNQADLGSLSSVVRDYFIRKIGKENWKNREEMVTKIWQGIRRDIESLRLDYHQVRLYQDGLPVCGKEEEIVRDLAQAGSENHKLLVELIGKGARLTGTESAQLLIEEYELARQNLSHLGQGLLKSNIQRGKNHGKTLLEKRDSFIANRINETLQCGETGLVFLGALHSMRGKLEANIERAGLRQR